MNTKNNQINQTISADKAFLSFILLKNHKKQLEEIAKRESRTLSNLLQIIVNKYLSGDKN